MYIHIGKRVIISDVNFLGVFNTQTNKLSENNSKYFEYIESDDKSIIIDKFDNIITSKISSYTIISRACEDLLNIKGFNKFNINKWYFHYI